jgi:hypothetical protein
MGDPSSETPAQQNPAQQNPAPANPAPANPVSATDKERDQLRRNEQSLRVFRIFLAALLISSVVFPRLVLNRVLEWQSTAIGSIPETVTAVAIPAPSAGPDLVRSIVKSVVSPDGDLRPVEKEEVFQPGGAGSGTRETISKTTSHGLKFWALWLQSVTLLAVFGGVLWAAVALCRID